MRAIHIEGVLNGRNVRKSMSLTNLGRHIGKRLSKLVRGDRWVDVMVPITWGRHWVLMILDFETRKALLVCYS